ncbi:MULTISPECIES: H-NS histone family protein [Burkholderia cepacia complex]|uniref:H-NS histone family protein n=1 Tax=Burkholderia cepacia complex TaxID=87882 RepID=UPI0009B58CE2
MGAVRHAREKCEQGGSFTSQLHRNERRFDSLSGKFDVVSPETSAVGPLISISLALIAQRESLDAQIIAARKAEREVAIGQIKALMKEFDLSVLDLQERVQKRNSKRMSTVPKYRDPATGKTWSGRGRQPAWLGNDPAAFLIQPDLPAI